MYFNLSEIMIKVVHNEIWKKLDDIVIATGSTYRQKMANLEAILVTVH